MRSAAAKAAEGRLMCLLILVPGRPVIGTKGAPWEAMMVHGVKGMAEGIPAYLSRKRAAIEIAMRSNGCDV